MNRLALLVLYCAAWAAPYARADDAAAMAVLRAGCTADVQRLCANAQAGGGRILARLRQHTDALSDQRKQAAQQAAGMSGKAAPNNPPSAPSPNAPPPQSPPPSAPARPARPAQPAPQVSASSAAKHAAPAASAASGSYLVLKKVQIKVKYDDPNEALSPAIEMLIPSTWDFQGAIHMYGGKTGCFSEAFSVFWEAKSPDGVTKFQGVPNFAWQYSDDPQELHNLTDPNRRTHTGTRQTISAPWPSP